MLMHGAKEPLGVTSGLVLYLDAANARSYPKSGTTWFDRSGNGNNGTLVNGVGYNGSNYGSLSFDGVDDYVNCLAQSSGSFTQSGWIKTNNVSTYHSIVSWGEHSPQKDRTLWLQVSTGRVALYFYSTTDNMITGTKNCADNNWHYVVGTWDGTTGKVYVDGYLENSGSLTASTYTYSSTNIGRNIIGNYNFNGNISQVSIYNRALSAAEVKQNYDAFKGRYGLT
jgi:hypothetical protein